VTLLDDEDDRCDGEEVELKICGGREEEDRGSCPKEEMVANSGVGVEVDDLMGLDPRWDSI